DKLVARHDNLGRFIGAAENEVGFDPSEDIGNRAVEFRIANHSVAVLVDTGEFQKIHDQLALNDGAVNLEARLAAGEVVRPHRRRDREAAYRTEHSANTAAITYDTPAHHEVTKGTKE